MARAETDVPSARIDRAIVRILVCSTLSHRRQPNVIATAISRHPIRPTPCVRPTTCIPLGKLSAFFVVRYIYPNNIAYQKENRKVPPIIIIPHQPELNPRLL